MDNLLNTKDVCRILNIPLGTLYKYTSEFLIPHIKIGKHLKFNEKELESWINNKKIC